MSSSFKISPNDVDRMNKSKTRTINFKDWKDIKRKELLNSAQPYISKRNRPVPGKLPPQDERVCGEFCPYYCDRVTLEARQLHFKRFYDLVYDEQSLYLLNCVKIVEPTRRRSGITDASSRRLCSFQYYVGGTRVCKKTFLNTFSIGHARLQGLQAKIKNGETAPRDMRGKHLSRPHAKLHAVMGLVKEHIASFPTQESHYSRNKTNKKYLSPDLSISKMYRHFKARHPDENISKTLYCKVFKTFNLRFGQPRSDTCKRCDSFYIQLKAANSEEERKEILIVGA